MGKNTINAAILALTVTTSLTHVFAQEKAEQTAEEKERERTVKGITTRNYVHNWEKFPTLEGIAVRGSKKMVFTPKKGRAVVILFLASWCLPCQHIIQDFKDLEDYYESRHTDFLYVFSHDTRADAEGFMETYGLKDNGIITTKKISYDFHQPPLPTIYVGDRQSWLTLRYIKPKIPDLKKLSEFLKVHTAF